MAIEELELSSRDSDESPSATELSAPLLSEEISSFSCPLVLFALLLSSQATNVKASATAANPQAIFKRRCFMASLLF
jgi:hypothetical protein